jgi:hypothetical protein
LVNKIPDNVFSCGQQPSSTVPRCGFVASGNDAKVSLLRFFFPRAFDVFALHLGHSRRLRCIDRSMQYRHTATSRVVAAIFNGQEPLLEAQIDAEND